MNQRTYANSPSDLRFTARRSPVLATRGMVACSQPLAAEAGLSILKAGGNAVDAAVAVAAGLAVCEPCMTGLGGDAFLLRYDAATQSVEGLNGSGRAPRALSLEQVRQDCGAEVRSIPQLHPHACTVPGAAGAWCDAIEKWGSLPLATVLEPAVRLAEEGFPVAPITAYLWKQQEDDLLQQRRLLRGKGPGLLVEDPDAPGGARAPYARPAPLHPRTKGPGRAKLPALPATPPRPPACAGARARSGATRRSPACCASSARTASAPFTRGARARPSWRRCARRAVSWRRMTCASTASAAAASTRRCAPRTTASSSSSARPTGRAAPAGGRNPL